MPEVAYLFERFPTFGQTFCYREVAELERQGLPVHVFSIRRPTGEPLEQWDSEIVRRVTYLPEEKELVTAIERGIGTKQLPPAVGQAISDWGRHPDFLRLYQAAYVGAELQKLKIARVHAHFAGMAARTAHWIGKFFGHRYSFTAHANDIFSPRKFVIGLDRLVAEAAAVVTVSDFAAAFLRDTFPDSRAHIHRIYNGIDLADFQTAAFVSPKPSIISIGRLIEKKGFADLIAACALLRGAGTEFTAQIIGEGPLHDDLARRIREHDLTDRVHLAGPLSQKQISERLAAATLFVLPCRVEKEGGMDNLPTVIMEAMAAGLPVVSTPIAGVPEMVEQGVTGELVSEGNVEALARAMKKFMADRHLAREFGKRGREAAQRKFSIVANVSALRSLLLET